MSAREPSSEGLRPELAEDTSIKLIGLGGVGGIVARYLALFLASLDQSLRLVLIDGDAFEPDNAGRMYYSEYGNKAEVSRAELAQRFADSRLGVDAVPEYLSEENIGRLLSDGDVVLVTVDNHATRKLVSEHCETALDDVCLISGGNDGVGPDGSGRTLRGTYGNCQVYLRQDGRALCPPLTRFHPEIREPADRNPADPGCADLLASVPQLLFTNLATASAILNAFFLVSCGALHYGELSFDIVDGLMRPLPLPGPGSPHRAT